MKDAQKKVFYHVKVISKQVKKNKHSQLKLLFNKNKGFKKV